MASSINSSTNADVPTNHYVFIEQPYGYMTPAALQNIKKEILSFQDTIITELEANKKFFTSAMTMWHRYNVEPDHTLFQCYYKLAVYNFYLKKYDESVSNINDALKILPNDPMAFYVRAKAYVEWNKRYLALSDILQACILVNFKINEFKELLQTLSAEIESTPLMNHGVKAFHEMENIEYVNKSLWEEIFKIWKSCNMYLIEKFPQSKIQYCANDSFLGAMKALYDGKFMEIVPRCNAALTGKGRYTNEARLLRALMHSQVYKRNLNIQNELSEDLNNLNVVLKTENLNENFKMWTKMCKASVYFALRKIGDANKVFNDLSKDYPENGLILFWRGYENCSVDTGSRIDIGLKYLNKAVALMPQFFLLKFYVLIFGVTVNSVPDGLKQYFNELKQLVTTYPNEIFPHMFLIGFFTQMKRNTNAVQRIRNAAELLKSQRNITLNMEQIDGLDLIIDYFKGCIAYDPNDFGAYIHLYEIFLNTKQDYGKTLELLNKGLKHMNEPSLHAKLFNLRHKLLVLISEQNFWNRVYAPQ